MSSMSSTSSDNQKEKEQPTDDDDNNTKNTTTTVRPPKIVQRKTVGTTKWLQLDTVSYQDQTGKERQWDYATRTTKQAKHKPDAVVIIPLLQHRNRPATTTTTEQDMILDTLVVEQYRPPLESTTLEFPAGLIDPGETPQQAAVRELREECGYYVGDAEAACTMVPTGVWAASASSLPSASPLVCMSPGLCDETVVCVLVRVDLDNPYNQDGHPFRLPPQPDDGEYITTHRIPLREGLQHLQSMLRSPPPTQTTPEDPTPNHHGPIPIQGLYLFALGVEIGKSLHSK